MPVTENRNTSRTAQITRTTSRDWPADEFLCGVALILNLNSGSARDAGWWRAPARIMPAGTSALISIQPPSYRITTYYSVEDYCNVFSGHEFSRAANSRQHSALAAEGIFPESLRVLFGP